MASEDLDGLRPIDSAGAATPLERVIAAQRAQAAAAASQVPAPNPVAPADGVTPAFSLAPAEDPVPAGPGAPPANTGELSDALLRAEAFGEDMSAAALQVADEVDAREVVRDAAVHGSDLALAIQLAGAQDVAAAGAGAPLRLEPTVAEEEDDRYKIRRIGGSPREEHDHDEQEDAENRREQDEQRLEDSYGQFTDEAVHHDE